MVEEQEWHRLKKLISQWISLNVEIADKFREIAMDQAMALGGTAIVEQDKEFQISYPLSDQAQASLCELKKFLKDLDPDVSLREEIVQRENWNRNWESFFKPTEISKNIVILPEWEESDAFPHRVKTRIRPAMAFGTGTHETTQLCLELMEESLQKNDHVLDVGTGSGVLGMTALHLGAALVDAVDNDPLAAENIEDNLKLNGINSGFKFQISNRPNLGSAYDLMLVNIIKARLFPILPGYFNTLRSGGRVIISGLLTGEEQEMWDLLENSPWRIIDTRKKKEWIAFLCEVK